MTRIKAVLFDYGMVLTQGQDMATHAAMLRLTGLDFESFERYYWADRHAYDEGKTNGPAYWRAIAQAAGLALSTDALAELNRLDGQMWATENPRMTAWQSRLREAGLLTAVVSNMGDEIHKAVAAAHPWLANFDLLVWSYLLGYAKPEPAFYQYALDRLGIQAGEAIFVDDKAVNVEAARGMGIHAFVFTEAEALRRELAAAGFGTEIPLP